MFNKKNTLVFSMALVFAVSQSLQAQVPRPGGAPVNWVNVLQYDVCLQNVKSTDPGGGAEFYIHDGDLTSTIGNFLPSVIMGNSNVDVQHGASTTLYSGNILVSDIRQPKFKSQDRWIQLKLKGKLYEDDNSGDAELTGDKTLDVRIPESYLGTNIMKKSYPNETKVTIKFTNQYVETVKAYWVDFDGKEIFYKDIASDQTWQVPTYHRHLWRFKRSNGDIVDEVPLSTGIPIPADGKFVVGRTMKLASSYDTVKFFVRFTLKTVEADSAAGAEAIRNSK